MSSSACHLASLSLSLVGEGGQQLIDIVRASFALRGRCASKNCAIGWAFIHKHADIALRLSQRQGALERRKRSRDVALHLVGERLQHQDFDHAARPLACFRCLQEALQQSDCLTHGAVGTVAL